MTKDSSNLIFYGTSWCGDCHRSLTFLDQHEIKYSYINIDHDEIAAKKVTLINNGNRSVPTIIFPDGSSLTEPSNHELATKLNI